MGLLIHISYETPEGILVTSVYSKIVAFSCQFTNLLNNKEMTVRVQSKSYISREKRLGGYRDINIPSIPEFTVFTVSLTDTWADLAVLYTKTKESLIESGFSVDDVFESTDTIM